MIGPIQKRRLQQIRLCARIANGLGRSRPGRIGLQALRGNPVTRALVEGVLGFHRPFASIIEAQQYIAAYANEGHENTGNVRWHLGTSETPYLRDYPALFHIRSRQRGINTVFDLGGNAGNIFYRYDRYLSLPAGLGWTVCDLPKNVKLGEAYALEKNEARLRFTTDVCDMDAADLLLASG